MREFMMINWPPPAPVTSTTLPSKVKGADIFRWCMFLCYDVCFCVYGDVFTLRVCGWICRETLRRDFCPTSANGAVTSPSSGQSDPRVFTPPGGTWLLFVRVIFIMLINNAEYKQCHSWCLSCSFTISVRVLMCKIVKSAVCVKCTVLDISSEWGIFT